MEKQEKPKNFDWVKARQECSVAVVMESLLVAARKNVESMTGADGQTRNDLKLVPFDGGSGFSVMRQGFTSAGARFYANHKGQILAETFGYKLEVNPVVAELTLDDDGDCRLKVGDTELQEWQFLKRVLEPLFFHVQD